MPMHSVNGTRLYVEDTGGNGPPILFSHGLLWSTRMFDAQVLALRDHYRCIAYDHRGQGRSDVPAGGSISMETVYADAVALIESLGVAPCHFVGLSMGGFVGLRLAARRPELVASLTLLETSADPEPEDNVPRYRALVQVARRIGVGAVAPSVMKIMFGRTFLNDPARAAERMVQEALLRDNRRVIWKAVNGVIERRGVAEELSAIKAPTLIMVGEEDVATVPAKAERIHGLIPHARLVRIPRAGHSSSVEAPREVTAELRGFLESIATAQPAEARHAPV